MTSKLSILKPEFVESVCRQLNYLIGRNCFRVDSQTDVWNINDDSNTLELLYVLHASDEDNRGTDDDTLDKARLRLDFGDTIWRTCNEEERQETGESVREEGEFDILIWCAWRLQDNDNAICSSDSTHAQRAKGIQRLIGEKVISFEIFPPAWDATITFTGGLVLKIFCIYTQKDECETNWFFRNDWKLYCFNRADDIEIARIEWDIVSNSEMRCAKKEDSKEKPNQKDK